MSTKIRSLPSAITAAASAFPSKILPNSYFFEDLGLETSEVWIRSRTGVSERRVVEPAKQETCGSLAAEAAQVCLERRGMDARDLDALILATISPDLGFPATACLVQERIGASNAFAFDISGACTGYLYSLATAAGLIESGRCQRVMVIGAEAMSAILDYEDRGTCPLFGDGAGATLVEKVDEAYPGRVLDILLGSDGSGAKSLYRTGGGALHLKQYDQHSEFPQHEKVQQVGRVVFRAAVSQMTELVPEILERNGLTLDDVDLIVPHQANIRIIDAVCDRLGLGLDKVAIYIKHYGNTTAATLPTALSLSVDEGRLDPGDLVLFVTFGAGFTWGAGLVRWGRGW